MCRPTKFSKVFFIVCLFLFVSQKICFAQSKDIIDGLRKQVILLCDSFSGRGYVDRGSDRAAEYLAQQFRDYGLKRFSSQPYIQPYTFNVNTFPGSMSVKIDGKSLRPGIDFLINPASTTLYKENMEIQYVDALKSQVGNPGSSAQLVYNLDSMLRRDHISEREWISHLDNGIYLIPKSSKPLWWVATDTIRPQIIYLYDSTLLNNQVINISAGISNNFISEYPAKNIAGYIPGTAYPDSFIVITAHYDHLGKMGDNAIFPGASDNASGTAMLLSLAQYYARHPQEYSIAFLLFSGEEAGLLGSFYYTEHPLFPLSNIRFLLNMDIMGDATEGITVVNGNIHQQQYDLLKNLNSMLVDSLPEIRSRGAAANSDHYPFSQAGVPAIFIYSNGGKGFYHDTWDDAATLSFRNIPALRELLIRFINKLNER